jgi:uncharacterized membrane protein YvbJ
MTDLIHTCGWQHRPEDKFCRGCGERIFKVSRDYSEILAEMETIKKAVAEKPNPLFASMAIMLMNVLSWASGEAHTRPSDMLKEVEKMADRFPGGFGGMGFQPPPPSNPE